MAQHSSRNKELEEGVSDMNTSSLTVKRYFLFFLYEF